jgi:uncharacterized protein YegL
MLASTTIGNLAATAARAVLVAATTLAWSGLLSAAEAVPAKPRIEVCFVLDTTGSMSGLIEGAKQKIWSIANELIAATPRPELKIGLVAYRDRGDAYVTQATDLTADIDAVHGTLRGFSAGGGGDGPESVNQALRESVEKLSWSADEGVLKIVFLVGDAPPHMDYADDVPYSAVCQAAVKRGLVINAVQCGAQGDTTRVWKEIAALAEGRYIALPQEGGMVAITSPQDGEIAAVNRALGRTLVAYGAAERRREVGAKQAASEGAGASAAADRLAYNAATGRAVQGEGELIDAIARDEVRLEDVRQEDLPEDLRGMSREQLSAHVAAKREERAALQEKLRGLLAEREAHIEAERRRLAAEGRGDAFDAEVTAAVREQAARLDSRRGE